MEIGCSCTSKMCQCDVEKMDTCCASQRNWASMESISMSSRVLVCSVHNVLHFSVCSFTASELKNKEARTPTTFLGLLFQGAFWYPSSPVNVSHPPLLRSVGTLWALHCVRQLGGIESVGVVDAVHQSTDLILWQGGSAGQDPVVVGMMDGVRGTVIRTELFPNNTVGKKHKHTHQMISVWKRT